ncbi:uncharacterized protein K452DRAFT_295373 [Aplosporella prunicola CBS 121167]|uniref:Double-strand break repair protein n=1 Tax=Aplosporella prunicola CBS 121167 TaxID=1176127 RepID=A0A6A6BPZ3_9PEZI|nr:uncharacterized protein K452DRAFT_295373 [Aplosporella prunicola CBS 121167]KAF2145808.1 hypothetical protein K452DRAFT_295373 [Aplosporella prunicola CBS 121167]
MPAATSADTIRILVATDSHVGYNERDAIRGDDSWRSFHEVMCLAKERDVDMVLLAGDLFHENKPSRKSMYQVMRSLRMNCYGDKPCELELLSDASENFQGAFNNVNYEDPDINVAIPVFSIHGNHDDPSGEGHLAALDLLQVSGLVNYYGRTPEADNIQIKPVLLQKGRTKLALYGMSNVRDERLFRTFRDSNVKFFQPSQQKDEWFNLMSVHQNHHAYTETGYLPENFLPNFLNLVVWGHEHECLIEPRHNTQMGFRVMQPGSSIATSLMPGEAVPKHVAIVSIIGKEFESESIRLKTVRPFVMKHIELCKERGLKDVAKMDNNRPKITRHLTDIVESLIAQAKEEWLEIQDPPGEDDEELEVPLPLIRLRVEYSAPDGGKFDCENPQRFSNRFVGKVANINDVIQFYRSKKPPKRSNKNDQPEMPEEEIIAQLSLDNNIKVEKLVREYLTAQSLTVFPQNSFGDAVSQFVDKDDKSAMEMFVNDSLASQVKYLLSLTDKDIEKENLGDEMEKYREKLEELFAAGHLKNKTTRKLKPKPDNWDTDMDGDWADQPGAHIHDEDQAGEDDDDEFGSVPPKPAATRGRGRGRGGRTAASGTTRATAASKKKAPAKTTGRGKKKKPVEEEKEEEEEEDEEADDDVIMLDDDDDDDDDSDAEELFVRSKARTAKKPTASKAKSQPARKTGKQTTLNFSQASQSQTATKGAGKKAQQISDDEISDDDDDAFEPPAPTTWSSRSRR